ncbi:asparaginase [Candidatus Woesearchaeota archaeon]|nr:asparaginase [Candidatus Woesearchaeota archaeon]
MKIKIFATGGTFDKVYDEISGNLMFMETHLPSMLYQARCRLDISIESIVLMDSLDMKLYHRQQITEKCKSCLEDRIVITHGTDTMVETAKLLGTEIHNKTVVLTGAMIPYSFVISDAFFNLGCALAYVQMLPYGTYITMNGRIFNHDNVRKNKERGEFETIK